MRSKRFGYVFAIVFLLLILGGCGGGSSAVPGDQTSAGSGYGVLPGGSSDSEATGMAALTWEAPTTNVDGTALTKVVGYRIYYGSAPGAYKGYLDAGSRLDFSISVAPGTYYFAVSAYNSSGGESIPSNEVSKTVL